MFFKGLIDRWESLEKSADDLQKVRVLRREMCALKEELHGVGDRVARMSVKVEDRNQLEARIQDVQVSYFWFAFLFCIV